MIPVLETAFKRFGEDMKLYGFYLVLDPIIYHARSAVKYLSNSYIDLFRLIDDFHTFPMSSHKISEIRFDYLHPDLKNLSPDNYHLGEVRFYVHKFKTTFFRMW